MAVQAHGGFADRLADESPRLNFRLGTWNLRWLFDQDTSDDSSAIGYRFAAASDAVFNERVGRVADVIARLELDTIALQEVENRKVLRRLAGELEAKHGQLFEVAFVQGNDSYTGQDVGFLVRGVWPVKAERFAFKHVGRKGFKDLSKHAYIDMKIGGETFRIITVHLSSRLSPRKRQANTLRSWLDASIGQVDHVVVLGDFNVELRHTSTAPGADLGTILGLDTWTTADDLVDLHRTLSANDRITHAGGMELDRVLVTPSLVDSEVVDLVSLANEREASGTISDHYPLVAEFEIAP